MQDAQSTYSNAGAPATPTAAQSVTGYPGDGLGSHMITSGINLASGRAQHQQCPLLATTHIQSAQRFFTVFWAPRSGRTPNYNKWLIQLRRLVHAFGLEPMWLDREPPRQPIPQLDDALDVPLQFYANLRAARENWLIINTAMYWHVLASLLLDRGVHARSDAATVESYVNGQLADGQALLRWALQFVDLRTPDASFNMMHHWRGATLKANATCSEIYSHADLLRDLFEQLATHSPASNTTSAHYFEHLLHTVPKADQGGLMPALRAWLAARLTELKAGQAPDFLSIESGVTAILEYASQLGVPQGQIVTMHAIGTDGKVTISNITGSADSPQLHVLDAKPVRGSELKASLDASKKKWVNNCPLAFCDCNGCSDRAVGCIVKNMEANIDHLTEGMKRYVWRLREYLKAHPGVTSVKGLQLNVAAAKAKEAKPFSKGPSQTKRPGGVQAMLGATLEPTAEFDSWLEEHDTAIGLGVVCLEAVLAGTDAQDSSFDQWLHSDSERTASDDERRNRELATVSLHSTSLNLGLAADSLQGDYDMASMYTNVDHEFDSWLEEHDTAIGLGVVCLEAVLAGTDAQDSSFDQWLHQHHLQSPALAMLGTTPTSVAYDSVGTPATASPAALSPAAAELQSPLSPARGGMHVSSPLCANSALTPTVSMQQAGTLHAVGARKSTEDSPLTLQAGGLTVTVANNSKLATQGPWLRTVTQGTYAILSAASALSDKRWVALAFAAALSKPWQSPYVQQLATAMGQSITEAVRRALTQLVQSGLPLAGGLVQGAALQILRLATGLLRALRGITTAPVAQAALKGLSDLTDTEVVGAPDEAPSWAQQTVAATVQSVVPAASPAVSAEGGTAAGSAADDDGFVQQVEGHGVNGALQSIVAPPKPAKRMTRVPVTVPQADDHDVLHQAINAVAQAERLVVGGHAVDPQVIRAQTQPLGHRMGYVRWTCAASVNLRAALAKWIWPGKYPRLQDAAIAHGADPGNTRNFSARLAAWARAVLDDVALQCMLAAAASPFTCPLGVLASAAQHSSLATVSVGPEPQVAPRVLLALDVTDDPDQPVKVRLSFPCPSLHLVASSQMPCLEDLADDEVMDSVISSICVVCGSLDCECALSCSEISLMYVDCVHERLHECMSDYDCVHMCIECEALDCVCGDSQALKRPRLDYPAPVELHFDDYLERGLLDASAPAEPHPDESLPLHELLNRDLAGSPRGTEYGFDTVMSVLDSYYHSDSERTASDDERRNRELATVSMHSTSLNLGLAADSLRGDYDMAGVYTDVDHRVQFEPCEVIYFQESHTTATTAASERLAEEEWDRNAMRNARAALIQRAFRELVERRQLRMLRMWPDLTYTNEVDLLDGYDSRTLRTELLVVSAKVHDLLDDIDIGQQCSDDEDPLEMVRRRLRALLNLLSMMRLPRRLHREVCSRIRQGWLMRSIYQFKPKRTPRRPSARDLWQGLADTTRTSTCPPRPGSRQGKHRRAAPPSTPTQAHNAPPSRQPELVAAPPTKKGTRRQRRAILKAKAKAAASGGQNASPKRGGSLPTRRAYSPFVGEQLRFDAGPIKTMPELSNTAVCFDAGPIKTMPKLSNTLDALDRLSRVVMPEFDEWLLAHSIELEPTPPQSSHCPVAVSAQQPLPSKRRRRGRRGRSRRDDKAKRLAALEQDDAVEKEGLDRVVALVRVLHRERSHARVKRAARLIQAAWWIYRSTLRLDVHVQLSSGLDGDPSATVTQWFDYYRATFADVFTYLIERLRLGHRQSHYLRTVAGEGGSSHYKNNTNLTATLCEINQGRSYRQMSFAARICGLQLELCAYCPHTRQPGQAVTPTQHIRTQSEQCGSRGCANRVGRMFVLYPGQSGPAADAYIAALSAVANGVKGAALDIILRKLSVALGVEPTRASYRAITAVLSRTARLHLTDEEAWKANRSKPSCYYTWKRRINEARSFVKPCPSRDPAGSYTSVVGQMYALPSCTASAPTMKGGIPPPAEHEEGGSVSHTYPPGTLEDDSQCVPALSDNGASYETHCSRTLDGALLDTYNPDDAGDLDLGDADSKLRCCGSYEYVYERFGADGSGELVVRRMKHTPNLQLKVVFSEPTEVYKHRYRFDFTDTGRVMRSPSGHSIPLHMSSHKLGWLKVRPVTDERLINLARSGSLRVIGDGSPKAAGMSGHGQLRGVALLRREHVVNGHLNCRKLLQTLKAKGIPNGLVCKKDVDEFAREGCGSCESSKMRRRGFTLSTIDTCSTQAPVGKKWVCDSLSLRVPSAEHRYIKIFLAVDDGSSLAVCFGQLGETEADLQQAHDELRAFVRPHHGEIWIIRKDSLPAHRAQQLHDYLSNAQVRDELSPPYVHEGVGAAENIFQHVVPSANALLMAAPDLGEAHFYTAFRTALAGRNYVPLPAQEGDQLISPVMKFFGKTEWIPNPLLVYGSACKILVHPEARKSKFDAHGQAGVYTGPALRSHSPLHCSVWRGEYVDVDLGCINIDEREVLSRTKRDHPSHQPYNQQGATAPVKPALGEWYNPSTSPHPIDAAAAHAKHQERMDLESLPHQEGEPWHAGATPLSTEYSIGICSGRSRPGDIASWMSHLRPQHTHIRIDEIVGGYEHLIQRPHVLKALVELASRPLCVAVVLQLPCGPWSVVKFAAGDGPSPIFTTDAPDGVLNDDGSVVASAAAALRVLEAGLQIADAVARRGGQVISEHPIWQGVGSEMPTAGLEAHSSMHNTTTFRQFSLKHQMQSVLTDQCMSEHAHRKSTDLRSTPAAAGPLRKHLGCLRCTHPASAHGAPLRGKDEDGEYRTRAAQEYTSLFSYRVALSLTESLTSEARRGEEPLQEQEQGVLPAGRDAAASTTEDLSINEGSGCDFLVGDRVEVWWTKEKCWYPGTVASVQSQKVRGSTRSRASTSPTLTIHYDEHEGYDGELTYVHSLHNNEVRHLANPKGSFHLIDLPHEEAPHLTDTIMMNDIWIEIETQDVLNKWSLFTVHGDQGVQRATSINTLNARYWHTPINEREFLRSPQRALWRTAQEIKWDQYMQLNMFTWVLLSSVDQSKNKIYSTLWARKIKLNSDTTFLKLNPRWCLKGGTMDRDLFKSHAETLRLSTFRSVLAIKACHFAAFCDMLLDCSDAFQSTRTDTSDDHPPLYCWPAPGFERRSKNGERMVCHVHVGMQGRIDATRLFNTRLFQLLIDKADMTACLHDKQLVIFDTTPHCGTTSSLTETLNYLRTATDTPPQQRPLGYAMIGWHVDDGIGVACSVGWDLNVTTNRVIKYIQGTIETTYATTLTGWHGNKALGFTLTLDKTAGSVEMSAPDALSQLAQDVLEGAVTIKPKHVMTADFVGIEAGELPPADDPSHQQVKETMASCRHALGVLIWMSNAYPQIVMPVNTLCGQMHMPHPIQTLKCIRFLVMHLVAHPFGVRYGGHGMFGLERHEDLDVSSPYSGKKGMHFHWFNDANLHESRSVTGAVGMLGGGAIVTVSQRQHLSSPDSHTSEVVSAGTGYTIMCPIAGVLQELRIHLGLPVPFYLDSKSAVCVATSDTAVRKSAWLLRRVAVLEDGVKHGEITPLHINDPHMAADILTKYLPYPTWIRHTGYMINLPGTDYFITLK